jgi:hypothetical protein
MFVFTVSRPFVCGCHNISTMPRLQSPPRQTQRAAFPHCAFLTTSHQGLSACRIPGLPAHLSLRPDVYPLPQVLQPYGRFYHYRPCLPFWSRNPRQQGSFALRALPRVFTTTSPSATLLPSARFPVSPVIGPTSLRPLSPPGQGGLLQLPRISLWPCHRFHPAGAVPPRQPACGGPRGLRPSTAGSASEDNNFEATSAFGLTVAWPLAHHPDRWLCRWASEGSVSLPSAIQATGALASPPAGLSPAEHARLFWTYRRS